MLGVARRSCEETKNKIEADGGVFTEVLADLSDMASIDKVMEAAIAAYGRADILVNNAGIIKKTGCNRIHRRELGLSYSGQRKDGILLKSGICKAAYKAG